MQDDNKSPALFGGAGLFGLQPRRGLRGASLALEQIEHLLLLGEHGVDHRQQRALLVLVERFEEPQPLGEILVFEADLLEPLFPLGDQLVHRNAERARRLHHEIEPRAVLPRLSTRLTWVRCASIRSASSAWDQPRALRSSRRLLPSGEAASSGAGSVFSSRRSWDPRHLASAGAGWTGHAISSIFER
jgi:hypothetical protein